jgi:hypothetical protein
VSVGQTITPPLFIIEIIFFIANFKFLEEIFIFFISILVKLPKKRLKFKYNSMKFKIFKNKNIFQGVSEVWAGSLTKMKKIVSFLKSLKERKISKKNIVLAEQVFDNKVHILKKGDGGKKIKRN